MIIGISGGSGAGKSTLSRKLEEILPNSLLITVDKYMLKHSLNMEKEIFENLNIQKDPKVFCYNYFHDSFSNVKTWISTIENNVINDIQEDIKNNKEKEYIILDWCYLPLCNFFNKCDHTICVIGDYEKRKERLTKRLINKSSSKYDQYNISISDWKPDSYLKRLEFSDLSNKGYEFNHYITKDSTLENYYLDIGKIVDKIMIEKN